MIKKKSDQTKEAGSVYFKALFFIKEVKLSLIYAIRNHIINKNQHYPV